MQIFYDNDFWYDNPIIYGLLIGIILGSGSTFLLGINYLLPIFFLKYTWTLTAFTACLGLLIGCVYYIRKRR